MIVITHRGASRDAPEHTVAAYDLALEQGADALEVDVRATADGELVAIHDPTLRRTTGDARAVADLRARDLAALPSAARPLPVEAVFARYGRRTTIVVELKDPSPVAERRIVAAIDEHGLRQRVLLQSFDHGALARIRELDGELATAALYRSAVGRDRLTAEVERVAGWAGALVGPEAAIDAAVVRAAAERGLPVWAYTVNDDDAARRLAAIGVAGLITDVPGLARRALGEAPAPA